jgi:hypothetical protein
MVELQGDDQNDQFGDYEFYFKFEFAAEINALMDTNDRENLLFDAFRSMPGLEFETLDITYILHRNSRGLLNL